MCSPVVVDVLARAVESGAFGSDDALVRRLHLTAFALACAGGPRPGVALLDARTAVDLVLAALPSDAAQVAADAARWRDLPRDRMHRLRQVKNLLAPALVVSERAGDPRLDDWRAVHAVLP
ncbi:hypothetical protein [Cellulomonas telluris]|uniref:hypothetical protein n=1 Tax=Cellulomonas telluris TaxID=2306636 RepID=UPI0010A8DF75|nr:hypothetical protein [Cellulomonas telluris]